MFNIFKKKSDKISKANAKSASQLTYEKLKEEARQREEYRRIWERQMDAFKEADNIYKSGDKAKAIEIYEENVDEMLKHGDKCLNLRACFDLVHMYSNEGKMDKAWGLTNKIQYSLMKSDFPEAFTAKIRFEQYKILKKEKKYLDALSVLLVSSVLKGNDSTDRTCTVDTAYLLKEGKMAAKGIGLSQEDYQELIGKVVQLSKKGIITETEIRDLYTVFVREKGLIK